MAGVDEVLGLLDPAFLLFGSEGVSSKAEFGLLILIGTRVAIRTPQHLLRITPSILSFINRGLGMLESHA